MNFPQTIEIEVTQADIDNGTPGCVAGCPIALAAQRAFPELLVYMGVFNLEMVELKTKQAAVYRAERDALWFRYKFDRGKRRHGLQPAILHFERYDEGKRKK
jgi:hypothetical protein